MSVKISIRFKKLKNETNMFFYNQKITQECMIKIRICESEEGTVPYVLKFLINLFTSNYKILNE